MNLITSRRGKVSSGLILLYALLAASLFPSVGPNAAATETLGITDVTGSPISAGAPTIIQFTLVNPATNSYSIAQFDVTVPSGWPLGACFPGSSLVDSASTASQCEFSDSGGSPIAPGQNDTLGVQVTAPATGVYPFNGTFTTAVIDDSGPNPYTGPSFNVTAMDPNTTVAVTVTPGGGNTQTSYTPGTAPYTLTATVTPAQAGLQIDWTASYTPSSATYSFTPRSGTTDSSGESSTVFQPSNSPGASATIEAYVGSSGLASTPTQAITTAGTVTSTTTSSTSSTTTTSSTSTSTTHTTSTSSSSTTSYSTSSTFSTTTSTYSTTSQTTSTLVTTSSSSAVTTSSTTSPTSSTSASVSSSTSHTSSTTSSSISSASSTTTTSGAQTTTSSTHTTQPVITEASKSLSPAEVTIIAVALIAAAIIIAMVLKMMETRRDSSRAQD